MATAGTGPTGPLSFIREYGPRVVGAIKNSLPNLTFGAKKVVDEQRMLDPSHRTEYLRLSGELSTKAREFFDAFVAKAGPNGRATCERLQTYWTTGGKSGNGEPVPSIMHDINKLATSNWPKFLKEKARIQEVFQSFIDNDLAGDGNFNIGQADAIATALVSNLFSSTATAVKTTSVFTKITAGTASALSFTATAIKTWIANMAYRWPLLTGGVGATLFIYSPNIGKWTISAIPSSTGYIIDGAANKISMGLNAVNLPEAANLFANTTVQQQLLSGYNSGMDFASGYICSFSTPYHVFPSCRVDDNSVPLAAQATDQGLRYTEELGKAFVKGAFSYGSEKVNDGINFVKENAQAKINEATNAFTQAQENISQATSGAEEALKKEFHNSTLLQVAAVVTSLAIVVLVGRQIWKTLTPAAPAVKKDNDGAKKG